MASTTVGLFYSISGSSRPRPPPAGAKADGSRHSASADEWNGVGIAADRASESALSKCSSFSHLLHQNDLKLSMAGIQSRRGTSKEAGGASGQRTSPSSRSLQELLRFNCPRGARPPRPTLARELRAQGDHSSLTLCWAPGANLHGRFQSRPHQFCPSTSRPQHSPLSTYLPHSRSP